MPTVWTAICTKELHQGGMRDITEASDVIHHLLSLLLQPSKAISCHLLVHISYSTETFCRALSLFVRSRRWPDASAKVIELTSIIIFARLRLAGLIFCIDRAVQEKLLTLSMQFMDLIATYFWADFHHALYTCKGHIIAKPSSRQGL